MSGLHSTVLPDTTFVTIPAAAGLDADSALPWLIDVDVFEQAVSNTNWNSIVVDTVDILNANLQSTGAQNAEVNYDVVLASGTWTVELMYNRLAETGIYSVQFDGVEKGTIDSYSASQAANILGSVTGIAVTASAKIRLKLKMATKNASSGGYLGVLQHVQLRRTA